MITLYTFGPAFGLPDPSPFVTKAMVLLKLSGVPFECRVGDRGKTPKGKMPYLDDGGTLVGDSTFIRFHLETKYGVDFDKGLSASERGAAWAFEKLCEDNLYWASMHARWIDDANFDRGVKMFFNGIPMPLRQVVIAMVRRGVRKSLHAQGLGRHTREQIEEIAIRGVDSIAAFLAGKTYLLGDTVSGADATIFAFVNSMLCPLFVTPIRDAAEKHPNLVAYAARGRTQWFPELAA